MTTTEKKKFTQTKHEHMSWTTCYENDCQTHLSDKKKSNWYSRSSRENRNAKQFATIHRALIAHNEFSNDKSFTQIQHEEIANEEFEFDELDQILIKIDQKKEKLQNSIQELVRNVEAT